MAAGVDEAAAEPVDEGKPEAMALNKLLYRCAFQERADRINVISV
jgi:hypothetical protein